MISHDDWLVSHLQSTFSPGELAHHPPSHSRQVTARRQVAALETRGGTTSEIYSGRWLGIFLMFFTGIVMRY